MSKWSKVLDALLCHPNENNVYIPGTNPNQAPAESNNDMVDSELTETRSIVPTEAGRDVNPETANYNRGDSPPTITFHRQETFEPMMNTPVAHYTAPHNIAYPQEFSPDTPTIPMPLAPPPSPIDQPGTNSDILESGTALTQLLGMRAPDNTGLNMAVTTGEADTGETVHGNILNLGGGFTENDIVVTVIGMAPGTGNVMVFALDPTTGVYTRVPHLHHGIEHINLTHDEAHGENTTTALHTVDNEINHEALPVPLPITDEHRQTAGAPPLPLAIQTPLPIHGTTVELQPPITLETHTALVSIESQIGVRTDIAGGILTPIVPSDGMSDMSGGSGFPQTPSGFGTSRCHVLPIASVNQVNGGHHVDTNATHYGRIFAVFALTIAVASYIIYQFDLLNLLGKTEHRDDNEL